MSAPMYDAYHDGYRVYVGGLDPEITRADIEKEFQRFGQISDCWVAKNPPGFSFIIYKKGSDADYAVSKMHDKRLFGSRLKVEHARHPSNPRGFANGREKSPKRRSPAPRGRSPAPRGRSPPPRGRSPPPRGRSTSRGRRGGGGGGGYGGRFGNFAPMGRRSRSRSYRRRSRSRQRSNSRGMRRTNNTRNYRKPKSRSLSLRQRYGKRRSISRDRKRSRSRGDSRDKRNRRRSRSRKQSDEKRNRPRTRSRSRKRTRTPSADSRESKKGSPLRFRSSSKIKKSPKNGESSDGSKSRSNSVKNEIRFTKSHSFSPERQVSIHDESDRPNGGRRNDSSDRDNS